jgi:hypothetical protein
VQSLYQNAVSVAAITVGAWTVCLRHNLRSTAIKLLAVGLIAAASLLPYLTRISAAYHISTTGWLAVRSWKVFLPLRDAACFPLPEFCSVWIASVLVIIAVGVVRLQLPLRTVSALDRNDALLFGGVTLLTALLGFVGFFWFVGLFTRIWHFIPLLALVAACIDLVPLPSSRLARTIFFGFVLASAIVSTAFAYRDLKTRFTTVDLVAARLHDKASPRDYILISPWFCGISYERYHQSAALWETLPPITNHTVHRADLIYKYMQSSNALQYVREKISNTLQNGGRVWFVGNDLYIPERGMPAPADLPPPPLKKTGWQDIPYHLVWSAQIMQFLSDHSRRFVPVELNLTQPVNEDEDLQLGVAEGWRDEITYPPSVNR